VRYPAFDSWRNSTRGCTVGVAGRPTSAFMDGQEWSSSALPRTAHLFPLPNSATSRLPEYRRPPGIATLMCAATATAFRLSTPEHAGSPHRTRGQFAGVRSPEFRSKQAAIAVQTSRRASWLGDRA
jgi:hypothetical protein